MQEAKRRERRQEVQLLEAREQLTQQETKAQQAESALQALRGEHAAAVDRHRRAQIQANQRVTACSDPSTMPPPDWSLNSEKPSIRSVLEEPCTGMPSCR